MLRLITTFVACLLSASLFAASLEAPTSASQGGDISVTWDAPGDQYDSVYIVPVGANDNATGITTKSILNKKNPVTLAVPEKPGAYELRYWSFQQKVVVVRRPLTVEDVPTTLTAADTAPQGTKLEVHWEGPGNAYDGIALFPAGAASGSKSISFQSILSRRNPVTLRLPDEPGEYELRYITRRDKIIKATRPLSVTGIGARIDAPGVAVASRSLDVHWTGPGNNYDTIALYLASGTADAKAITSSTILNGKNPIVVNLPDAEGDYELRYITTQTRKVLAVKSLRIDPAGRLAVSYTGENTITSGGGSGAVELVLDASGSMLKRTASGERRIAIAKTVLADLVTNYLQDGTQFALRAFGHRQADSCRTDLEISLRTLNRAEASSRIASINAMNLAKTPLADSLAKIPQDLAAAKGPKTVILITDGEETCEGDPDAVIRDLRSRGLNLRLSIVGFGIDDAELKETFTRWAELGGGSYFDTTSAEELSRSLRYVISGPFRVLNASGEVVGEGVMGGAEIVLASGTYRIETIGPNPRVIDNVSIKPRELTEARF